MKVESVDLHQENLRVPGFWCWIFRSRYPIKSVAECPIHIPFIFYDNLEKKKNRKSRVTILLGCHRTVQKVETLSLFYEDVFIELCISIHIWWCYHHMVRLFKQNAAPHPCRRKDRRLQWHLNHGMSYEQRMGNHGGMKHGV